MTMPRWIPNTLTLLRCGCALSLPLFPVESWGFVMVYVTAGVTDVLDGLIARRWKIVTPAGATLDSVADMLVSLVGLYVFLAFYQWPIWPMLWIGCIAALKAVTAVIGWRKYGDTPFLHTRMNKLAEVVVFVTPLCLIYFSLVFFSPVLPAVLAGAIATAAAGEELAITITSPVLHADIRSLAQSRNIMNGRGDRI